MPRLPTRRKCHKEHNRMTRADFESRPCRSGSRRFNHSTTLLREEVERKLECLRYALERREMKVTRSKTKYLCVNGGNDEETFKMEDTKVPRVKEFRYFGSTVQESGSCWREVKKRVQAG